MSESFTKSPELVERPLSPVLNSPVLEGLIGIIDEERFSSLDRREARIRKTEQELGQRLRRLEEQEKVFFEEEAKLKQMIRVYRRRLEKASVASTSEVLNLFRAELRREHAEDLKEFRRNLFIKDTEQVEHEGKRVLLDVLQRLKGNLTPASIYTVLPLPSEDYKGMVIGREGRNCKALEAATGVTVLVDEGESSVTLTGFDLVKREVARLALVDLINVGKITPALIEDAVEVARETLEKNIEKEGESVQEQLGIPSLGIEVSRLLGQLRYRLSRGQNTLEHSIEVAQMCALMASEIGLDPNLAKRAGLFHDIGKAMDGSSGMSHARSGARLLEIHGEPSEVVNAIEAHHQEVEETSLYAPIVQIADSISASREGARGGSQANMIERVEAIERTARNVPGVREAHSFRAGRELRVLVCSEQIDDFEIRRIAQEVRLQIESKIQVSEPIRITVIREVRFSETASS